MSSARVNAFAITCPLCKAPPMHVCTNDFGVVYAHMVHVQRREEGHHAVTIRRLTQGRRVQGSAAARAMRVTAFRQPCPLCSEPMWQPHLDHVVPLNVGGADHISNLRAICSDCNLRRPKDGSDLDERS